MSLFFVVTTLAMLLAIGLVVDGGGKIRAVQRADAAAAEAARQGGQAIQAGPAIRDGATVIDASAARVAAQRYLAAADVTGNATITNGTRLQVTTSTTYTPVFLSLMGIGPLRVNGHADVRLVRGVDGALP